MHPFLRIQRPKGLVETTKVKKMLEVYLAKKSSEVERRGSLVVFKRAENLFIIVRELGCGRK